MRKIILFETGLFILTAGVSVGLYQIFYGIDLTCNNYFDIIFFETKRKLLIMDIISRFFLPIYMGINCIRLIYYKFLKPYITGEIIISGLTSILIHFIYYYFGSEISNMYEIDGPAEQGWTIYPPLSSFPQLEDYDPARFEYKQNVQLGLIALVFTVMVITVSLTVRQKKRNYSK